MTNNIKIVFGNSDLHIQENLNAKNLKIRFGGIIDDGDKPIVEDIESIIFDESDYPNYGNEVEFIFGIAPIGPCDNTWIDVDGDKVDLDCSCLEEWIDVDGDKVDLNLDCSPTQNECDNTWNDDNNDFDCNCSENVSDNNDFNINCGGGKPPTSDLGRFNINGGENVKFEIHGLEIYNANCGENVDFSLTINRLELPIFDVKNGETLSNFDLSRERIVSFDISNSGEYLNPTISFASIANFSPISECGEYTEFNLSTEYSLITDNIEIGEETDYILSTYPSILLSFDSKSNGENVNLLLSSSAIINVDYEIGESSTCVINTYPSSFIEVNLNENGENVNVNFVSSIIIDSEIEVGEDVEFDLTKPYNPNLEEIVIEVGEYTEFDLAITPSLEFRWFYVGENASFNLSLIPSLELLKPIDIGEDVNVRFYESQTATLSSNMSSGEQLNSVQLITNSGFIVDVCGGECSDFDIEYDPYTGFPLEVLAGENVEFQLYRNRLIYPEEITVGETASSGFNIYPSAEMSYVTNGGENISVKMMIDIRLGEMNSYLGEEMIINLSSLENYEVSQGEESNFTLSTSLNVPFNSNQNGEYLSFDFKPGLPQYLSFNVNNGESIEGLVLRTLKSIDFNTTIRLGESIYINDWSIEAYHIDLDDRKCCDFITSSQMTHVELDEAPYNWTSYDFLGNACEMVTFDLSTRRAFTFYADAGETLVLDNTLNTFEFEVIEGQSQNIPSFRTITTIDLEESNNEPENPVIDVDRPDLPSNYSYIVSKQGEYVDFKLSVRNGLSANFYGGEIFVPSIVTQPPFYFESEFGEYVRFTLNTTVLLHPNMNYSGEQMRLTFYEQPNPYYVYIGEMLSFTLDTKSDYYAEFITDGCLNNDYTDIDPETGQPIPNEYNGAIVEGEMFMKFVEGRCF